MALGLAVPALAGEQPPFDPDAFQILGGVFDEGDGIARENRIAPVPENQQRRRVPFVSTLPPGSILVKTDARRLYFILGGGEAIEYRVGVGREGFTWSGTATVSRKAVWPDWRPPPEMIARERRRGHDLAAFVPGGPGNPLGARAIYIGDTAFRIHGTAEPWSIGRAVSSGCIRMFDAEVIELYDKVAVGATVVVE